MKIVAAGECCLDYFEGESEPRPGGISFNFALHAADAFPNAEIHLLSAVGTDSHAAFAARLEASGIHHDLSPVAATPSIAIRVDETGERSFYHYDPGGLLDWEASESQRRTIGESDLLVLTRYHEIATVFERLVRLPTRATRVVDFADISGTPATSINTVVADRGLADVCIFGISPTETELRNRLRVMADSHPGLFVITLGSGGAEAIENGEQYHQTAFPVPEVVDTTGAGDCFAAHFLGRWCASNVVEDALAAGCLAASRVIQHRGAS